MSCSTNLILQGGGRLLVAPVGEAIPADTLAAGATWGGNWTDTGPLKDPVALATSFSENQVMQQRSLMPRAIVKNAEEWTFSTSLQDISGANLQLALGGTVTQTPAGASQPAKDELQTGNTAYNERMFGIEGKMLSGLPIRIFIYRGISKSNGDITVDKDNEASQPIQIFALDTCDLGVGPINIQVMTAEATS